MRTPTPRRSQRGFTLIEIMAVVIIIGMLIGIVGYNVIGQVGTAERGTTAAQIENLSGALELYRLHNGFYPSTEQGLEALVRKPVGPPEPRSYPEGGYLRKSQLPRDPWGSPYGYRQPGQHGPFDLWSNGADGQPGGEGDAADIVSWAPDAQ